MTGGAIGSSQSRQRATLVLFVAATFLSASLVFLVQPMAARILLPKFGGSAAVWNTALVVFQTLLLAGYATAHFLSKLPSIPRRIIHVTLLTVPLAVLPFALPSTINASSPVRAVLITLTVMVGAPYLALTTMSPTMQQWFGETGHPLAVNPYPLYAAGNAGSLLALVAYPIAFEPLLDIRGQTLAFTIGYAVMAALVILAAFANRAGGGRTATTKATEPRPTMSTRMVIYVSFVPSFLLLGVTRHVTNDVASLPLLWVIPLVIYLGSFVIAFRGDSTTGPVLASRALRLLLIPAVLLSGRITFYLGLTLGVPLLVFALAAYLAHRRLYEGRPPVSDLTRFYMLLSIGGALGGVAGALVAPVIFDRVIEYPLGLVLAATLLISPRTTVTRTRAVVVTVAIIVALAGALNSTAEPTVLALIGLAGLIAYVMSWRNLVFSAALAAMAFAVLAPTGSDQILTRSRTFYGTYEVRDDGEAHTIVSGTTIHGVQRWVDGTPQPDALGYYEITGPIGSLTATLARESIDVGVIGLGAGALSHHVGSDDHLTYYEIDPLVEVLATDTDYFTFLSESAADLNVVIGDGRLELEKNPPNFDLLVVDAFTSDAIPIHLLTLEAFETYMASMTDDGILLVHISNRHFDLEPVLGRLAQELGLTARIMRFNPPANLPYGQPTVAVVASQSPEAIQRIADPATWSPLRSDGPLWTDAFSNVVAVLDW